MIKPGGGGVAWFKEGGRMEEYKFGAPLNRPSVSGGAGFFFEVKCNMVAHCRLLEPSSPCQSKRVRITEGGFRDI